jgi:LAO/AO transport system kinase
VTGHRSLPLPSEVLAAGVRKGDRALLGRAITLVESNRPEDRRRAEELLASLMPATGSAHRIGISGIPGVGKSTFIEAFGSRLTAAGHRVAVLAVDPSSALSRGSILADKTRMVRLGAHDAAFIRPSPAGGNLGGVARKTRESILVCEAAGFDVVLVETVGVGQSETLVAEMVDCFLLLMLAGAGDELQGIKRGIVEIADVIAINKADGDNLGATARARSELEGALRILRPPRAGRWSPRVLTVSSLTGSGLDELWQVLVEHRRWLAEGGRLPALRAQQGLQWMWALVDEALRDAARRHPKVAAMIDHVEAEVRSGRSTPAAGARALLEAFGLEVD